MLTFPFRAMASSHAIVLDGDDADRVARTARAMIAEVERIEAKYTRFRDTSLVAAINRAAGGDPVAIDAETAALFDYADACHASSGGRFDVTSGPLARLWDFRRESPRVPSDAEIAAALALVGWTRVERDGGTVRLPAAGMSIDLGGIGKEYAADRAAAIAIDAGVAHGCVDLAGDVRVWGGLPGGAPWRIGVRDPRAPGAAAGGIELADGAVATSGDYERAFVVDGRRYAHIVDATTGWPVGHWRSMSVVAPLCVAAGSGATVGMLLGPDAPDWLDAQGFDWLGVDAEGRRVRPSRTRPGGRGLRG